MGDTNYTVGIRIVSSSDDAAIAQTTAALNKMQATQAATDQERINRIPIIQAESSAQAGVAQATITVEEALSRLTPAEREAAAQAAQRGAAMRAEAEAGIQAAEATTEVGNTAETAGKKIGGMTGYINRMILRLAALYAIRETIRFLREASIEAEAASKALDALGVQAENVGIKAQAATGPGDALARTLEQYGIKYTDAIKAEQAFLAASGNVNDMLSATAMAFSIAAETGKPFTEVQNFLIKLMSQAGPLTKAQVDQLAAWGVHATTTQQALDELFTHYKDGLDKMEGANRGIDEAKSKWDDLKRRVGNFVNSYTQFWAPVIVKALSVVAMNMELMANVGTAALGAIGTSWVALETLVKTHSPSLAMKAAWTGIDGVVQKFKDDVAGTLKDFVTLNEAAKGLSGLNAPKAHGGGGAQAGTSKAEAAAKEQEAVDRLARAYTELAQREYDEAKRGLDVAEGAKAVTSAMQIAIDKRLALYTMEVNRIKATEAVELANENQTAKGRAAIRQAALLQIQAAEQKSANDVVHIQQMAAKRIEATAISTANIEKQLMAEVTKYYTQQEEQREKLDKAYDRLMLKSFRQQYMNAHLWQAKRLADHRKMLVDLAFAEAAAGNDTSAIWQRVSEVTQAIDTQLTQSKIDNAAKVASKSIELATAVFGKNKAVAAASIVVNTAMAVMQDLGKAGWVGIILAALDIATGAAELAKVNSAKAAGGAYLTGPTALLAGEAGPELVLPARYTRMFDRMAQQTTNNSTTVTHDNRRGSTIIYNDTFLSPGDRDIAIARHSRDQVKGDRTRMRSVLGGSNAKAGSTRAIP